MENILKIQKLFVELNATKILENINCNILKSKNTVIIGKSGAGKSTLIKAIVRFIPYSGEILFNGEPITNYKPNELRIKISYVGQTPTVFKGTVGDNIRLGREYWKMDTSDNVILKYLDMVGLPKNFLNKPAKKLSSGEKQRVHLARSLALEPEVLLLDEPASALDVINKSNFEEMINHLRKKKPDLSVVMITHDMEQARRMADQLILMDQGKILVETNADDFFNKILTNNIGDTDATMLSNLIKELQEEN